MTGIKACLEWTFQLARTFLWPSVPADSLLQAAAVGDRDVVERVFEWERERTTMMAKGMGGTASAVAVAAFAAAFDAKQLGDATVRLAGLAIAVLFLWAAILCVGIQTLGGQYTTTIRRMHQP